MNGNCRKYENLEGRASACDGFSLLELVASAAILLLLGVLIAQVSGAIQKTTVLSNRMVDAAAQARLAFDRMALDFDGLLRRWDVDFVADNAANANAAASADVLQMFSAVRSPDRDTLANRGISLIGYRVAPHPTFSGNPCLLRGSKSVGWDEVFMGLDSDQYPPKLIPTSNLATIPQALQLVFNSGPADYDVLAAGVIRMVVGFQLAPSNEGVHLKDGTNISNARGQIVYQPPVWDSGTPDNKYVDLTRVSAIVVGIAVLDLNTLKLLDPAQVNTLADAFSVPPEGRLPLSKWMGDTKNLGDLPATLPAPARQGVRIYQRAYHISSQHSEIL